MDDRPAVGVIALHPVADQPGQERLTGEAGRRQEDGARRAGLDPATGDHRDAARHDPRNQDRTRLGERDDHRQRPGDHCRDGRLELGLLAIPACHGQDEKRRRGRGQHDPQLLGPGQPVAKAVQRDRQADLGQGKGQEDEIETFVSSAEGDSHEEEQADDRDGGGQQIAADEMQPGWILDPARR